MKSLSNTRAVVACALTGSALLLVSCLQSPEAIHRSVNNSDPSKPTYVKPSPQDELAHFQKRGSITRRAEAVSHNLRMAKLEKNGESLGKSLTTYEVGFLDHGLVNCGTATITMHNEEDLNGNQLNWKHVSSGSWTAGTVTSGTRKIPVGYVIGSPPTPAAADYLGVRQYGVGSNPNTTVFSICEEEVSSLPQTGIGYAVFLMGDECPPGSYQFGRLFDTEDNSNVNGSTGDIYPSTSFDYHETKLEFCYVPPASSSPATPIWYTKYYKGVFAPSSLWASSDYSFQRYCGNNGGLLTDDEDDWNDNMWDWYSMPQQHIDYISGYFMNGETNTHMAFTWCNAGEFD